MKERVRIYTPFYGLLPFKFLGYWYWGRKLKKTYTVNRAWNIGGVEFIVKTELHN